MTTKVPAAFGSENMPVEIATTAKRYRISAVASFASPSPSSTTRMRRGSPSLRAIASGGTGTSSTSSGGNSSVGIPGTKASAMPASSSRIAGATLNRRASSAVPASTASRIRNIWNLASTVSNSCTGSICPDRRRRQCLRNRRGYSREWLVPQIVTIGLGDDLPSVVKLHRHQIVGEVARRQLAAHLDEGGGFIGAIDGHDEILARLALGPGGWPLSHAIQPVGHTEDLQLALFQPAQVGGGVEDRLELVGIAFVQPVEIMVDHGFDGGSVMTHGLCSLAMMRVYSV